jgi:hypothetical protein
MKIASTSVIAAVPGKHAGEPGRWVRKRVMIVKLAEIKKVTLQDRAELAIIHVSFVNNPG